MGLTMSPPLFIRCVLMISLFFVIILFVVYPIFITPVKQTLNLADKGIRTHYSELNYPERQEDLTILSQYLKITSMQLEASNFTLNGSILDPTSKLSKRMKRFVSMPSQIPPSSRLPSGMVLWPPLLNNSDSLKPAFLISKGKQNVSIVLGIPALKRENYSFLLRTLNNLIQNMNDEEQNDTMIVVFIGEIDLDYVHLLAKQIETTFWPYIESGLIEIISPPISYYPYWQTIYSPTQNESSELMNHEMPTKWYRYQTLSYSFLMGYAQTKGTFYVQLDDDILTKLGYITAMKNLATEKMADHIQWVVLDFCQSRFLGKMFKSTELPSIVSCFQKFYENDPIQCLDYIIRKRVCSNWARSTKNCGLEKEKLWINFTQSLFQPIGNADSIKDYFV